MSYRNRAQNELRLMPSGQVRGRMDALRLEKKRILKEDGRYLLFYHSAASASAEQKEAFAEVAAEPERLKAATARVKHGSAQTAPDRQERSDV